MKLDRFGKSFLHFTNFREKFQENSENSEKIPKIPKKNPKKFPIFAKLRPKYRNIRPRP